MFKSGATAKTKLPLPPLFILWGDFVLLLLKLFLVLIGLMIAFHLVTRKYLNPYRLFLIFGKKGSGKSTYLTKLAVKYMKKGWTIYTNMEDLMIPGVRFFTIEHLGNYVPDAHSLLLLDEVGMVWDSRDFKAFKPTVRDFFKLQRHYKVVVYMASQTFDVDKKIRDLTDGMYLQTNFLRVFSLGRRIFRTVTLTESTSEAESRICDNLKWAPVWYWTLTYIPKWGTMFDTAALPAKPNLEYVTVQAPEFANQSFLHRLRCHK